MEQETNTAVETQIEPEVVVETPVKKKKNADTGDLFLDTAKSVETMSKAQALAEADKLVGIAESSYFRLGGVFKAINDNSWFDGYPSFEAFVLGKYGFKDRKARYWIEIYDNLVTKQIPWEKVSHLGWTKMKTIAKILTLENLDYWVEKANVCTVADLEAILKPPTEAAGTTQTSNDGLVKVKLNFKPDQADIYNQAVAKAKGELKTDFDTVAIENICSGYMGGVFSAPKTVSFEEQYGSLDTEGFIELLTKLAAMYPKYNIKVEEVEEPTAEAIAEPATV